jgi:hypothetical protein
MKTLKYLFLSISVGLLFVSAAFAQQAEKKIYKNVEVEKFAIAEGVEKFPDAQLDVLMAEIVDELKRLNKFEQVAMNGAATEAASVAGMQLTGTITKYKPGSRTARYMIGFGAGMTKVKAKIKFVDSENGNVLFEKEIDGKVVMGFFGGDKNDATRGLAREIAEIAKKNFTDNQKTKS